MGGAYRFICSDCGGVLLLLPLLESFIIEASLVAVILWQLSWASGQLWQDQHSLLALSGFIGTLLLAASVLIWSIHYLKNHLNFHMNG